jgi:arylsulfatase A-like enzyme
MDFDDNFTLGRRADEITNLSINWLNSYKQENLKKPFFLWIHYSDPHLTYAPTKQYTEMFNESFIEKEENYTYLFFGKELNVSNKQIHELKIIYDGEIRFVDDNLKILFDYLNKTKILDNSIIIITADHGESLGEHNIFDHNDIYYGIIHIPLFIRYPNSLPEIINSPVSLVDIFPTVLDILKIRYNHDIRGKNLFKNLDKDNVQFAEKERGISIYTLIKNEYKLMLRGSNEMMLFNIKTDPEEKINLKISDEKIFDELKFNLMNILNSTTEIKKSEISEINETLRKEIEKNLRELGYLS